MKQHYIPRCYLKRFSREDKSIFAYDKQNSREYDTSLMSVCFEKDIYSISEDYVAQNNNEHKTQINRLSIEKDFFAKIIEPNFSQLLQELDSIKNEWVEGTDNYKLNFYEKRELALHLVTQYFRLPQLKESTINDYIRMEQANADMLKHFLAMQTGHKSFYDLQMQISCEAPVLHANLTYLNNELLMEFADIIASNYWVFRVSLNGDFYTSDFPLVVEPHIPHARPTYMGLAQYGGELTYPLSPFIVLSVYDKNYFKNKGNLDCNFIIADDKEIRRQNMLRYFYASRHIFSYNKDFSLIDFIYTLEGHHIFMAPNFKTAIVSGLGRY